MITPQCPKCRQTIPDGDVNVANDVLYCRRCNLASKFSDAVHGMQLDPDVDLLRPPKGAWYRDAGHKTTIGATHRSIPTALFTLAFGLFWNGIVSVFVVLALASTLSLAGIPTPEWFPAPKMNGSTMGIGMTVFLWLFLTPFILIGLVMIGAFLSALAGRTEIELTAADGVVFTGIGPLGRRKRFTTSSVTDVGIEHNRVVNRRGREGSRSAIVIAMKETDSLRFGSSLSEARMKFVAAALRQRLVTRRG